MWVSTGETQFEIKNTITATHNMFATTWCRTFDQSAFTVGKTQTIMEDTSDRSH